MMLGEITTNVTGPQGRHTQCSCYSTVTCRSRALEAASTWPGFPCKRRVPSAIPWLKQRQHRWARAWLLAACTQAPGGAGLGFCAADALVSSSGDCKTRQCALEHGSLAMRKCRCNCISDTATGERALACLTGGHAQLQAAPGQRTSRFSLSKHVSATLLRVQALNPCIGELNWLTFCARPKSGKQSVARRTDPKRAAPPQRLVSSRRSSHFADTCTGLRQGRRLLAGACRGRAGAEQWLHCWGSGDNVCDKGAAPPSAVFPAAAAHLPPCQHLLHIELRP